MAENEGQTPKFSDALEVQRKMTRIAERSQKLVNEFLARQQSEGKTPSLDPLNVGGAFFEMTARMMTDPTKFMQAQVGLWNDYVSLWEHATRKMMGAESEPVVKPERSDRRFRDPAWDENTVFDFIKQSYLLSARYMQSMVQDVEGMDEKTARKVDFYNRQFVDAMAPSNFVMTNPEVLRTTMETGGENLLEGLENLLDDLERGNGRLQIRMTDTEAFKVGENIATTPGKVVYENELLQLIQYTPTTETVHKRPLLIIPPWINKYYILDLREKNSFVKWAVAQGHTVFMISWVNPDSSLADKTFEDYMLQGPLEAMDAITRQTGEDDLNVIGYCLGGTLLACTLAYMTARNDNRVKSATYFTTMIDFTEAGELSIFIDEEQLAALEGRMNEKGYLDGSAMQTTFNMLRANDLIWSFVVNNYLLGKDPFPFDLLYWNSDSTRMPAAMHSFYLRRMYQDNKLVEPGGITLAGVPIDITTIKQPTLILSTREDHIAPWKSTYLATNHYSGPTRFVLAASGHIAGVVNPPDANKYCYWTNNSNPKDPDSWLRGATETPGSWWPEWHKWISEYAGPMIPARDPEAGPLPVIEDAPGRYVKVQAISDEPDQSATPSKSPGPTTGAAKATSTKSADAGKSGATGQSGSSGRKTASTGTASAKTGSTRTASTKAASTKAASTKTASTKAASTKAASTKTASTRSSSAKTTSATAAPAKGGSGTSAAKSSSRKAGSTPAGSTKAKAAGSSRSAKSATTAPRSDTSKPADGKQAATKPTSGSGSARKSTKARSTASKRKTTGGAGTRSKS